MVFTIITYYRRHLYGVYHHNLLEGTSMVFTIITYYNYLLEGTSMVFTITTCWKGTSMVFTITTYYKHPVRRHLYGVYHHNLLQSC